MPRYNKESFLDLLNEDQPKLETISFETISKVVKNCTEIKKVNRDLSINRNDLILSIDRLFYDTENLEDQSKIFRIILDQSTLETLKSVKKYVELSTKVKKIWTII